MNKKFFGNVVVKAGFVTFALALGLAACGDGGSTNGPSNNHEGANVSSVESEDDLPSCTESREGFVRFIDGTKEGFVCKDRKWVHYDMIADVEENLPGCTGSREGLSAYLYEEDRELNCVEGSWDVGGEVASSSSSVILSDSEGSSCSSAKSSSSSVASSSSMKAAWAYLNPNIDYGEFTDERDGQVYKTVKIGTQTWMAENLNYRYVGVKYDYDGYTSDSTSWCYDDKASNCDKYGRLYTWSAVMDSAAQFSVNAGTKCGYGKTCTPNSPHRGICPEGWHVPTNEGYSSLLTYIYIDGSSFPGSLRSMNGWGGSENGTDMYGFSALPAGFMWSRVSFDLRGAVTSFWTASEDSSYRAWSLGLNAPNFDLGQSAKDYGRSLRCLKDSSSVTSSSSVVSSSSTSVPGSSSSVIPDSDRGSSSSSAKSSSSVASSSSMKAAWAYLNPNIDYGEFTDERDGQVYKTVKIGYQTWMAENLNYAYTGVKYNYDSYTSDSTSWCYENEASNCDKYGRLYTWSAVMDSAAQFSVNAGTKCGYGKTCTPNSPHRGICPEGWHVPTKQEDSTLLTYIYIDGSSFPGSLRSMNGWGGSENGTDMYGFSALPAGFMWSSVSFELRGAVTSFWTASEDSSYRAWSLGLNAPNFDLGQSAKDDGRSLRCLKD